MFGFFVALQFLTRLPVPLSGEADLKLMPRSTLFFPLVGAVIGLILAGAAFLLSFLLPYQVVVSAVIVLSFMITGGMHADGLMDTADGLFSGRSREKMLEIMRDSRVGAMGVIALVSLVVIKFSLLLAVFQNAGTGGAYFALVLVAAATCSRWAMAGAICFCPYARSGPGLGKTFAGKATKRELAVATVVTIVVVAGLLKWLGLVVIGSVALATAVMCWYICRRLGGLTGDTYGAINEIMEVVVLLVVVLLGGDIVE